MERITHKRNFWALLTGLALAANLLAASPASAESGYGLHLKVDFQFADGICLNPPSCSFWGVNADGVVFSNLGGQGTFHSYFTVDFSPGGTCNIVDEYPVFTFTTGTIFVHSIHEDCRTAGLRIATKFSIIGGNGAFSGATGGGFEFIPTAHGNGGLLQYDGQISYER